MAATAAVVGALEGPQEGAQVAKTAAAVAAAAREGELEALPAAAKAAAAAAAAKAKVTAGPASASAMPAPMKRASQLESYSLIAYKNVVYWLKPFIITPSTRYTDAIVDPNKFTMHVYKRPGEQAMVDPTTPPSFIIERDPISPGEAFVPVPYTGGEKRGGGDEPADEENEEGEEESEEGEEEVEA
jgi:hypothetical protein